MLERIHFCPNHDRRVKRYRRLVFKPGINFLVGPNGSGKSTILQSIASCDRCDRQENGDTDYVLFDTERMNPRLATGSAGSYTNMVLRVRANFSSHGESLQAAFSAIHLSPHSCLLLDEPESGQDFDHVLALRKAMDRAAARGTQIICATHHLLLWDRAHIIDLRRGYRDRVLRNVCRRLCTDHDPPPSA